VHERSLRPSHPTGVGIQQGLFSKKKLYDFKVAFIVLVMASPRDFKKVLTCRKFLVWWKLSSLDEKKLWNVFQFFVVMGKPNDV
jgi:hypothetical protein